MRKHKIPLEKVQRAFNDAIKRRDRICMVKDFEPCFGQLEASHFFCVGSSSAMRFYPPNCYAQCQKHHWNHHNKDVPFYFNFMTYFRRDDLDYMETHRNMYIKYTDELKAEIIRLCNADKLDELKELIEKELEHD